MRFKKSYPLLYERLEWECPHCKKSNIDSDPTWRDKELSYTMTCLKCNKRYTRVGNIEKDKEQN